MATKLDANGLTTSYSYDSANRLTGVSPGSDPCQAVSYTYGTNGTSYGRVASINYGTTNHGCAGWAAPTSYTELYAYNSAGAVTARVDWDEPELWTDSDWNTWTLNSDGRWGYLGVYYTYDSWGNVTQEQYSGSEPFKSAVDSTDEEVNLVFTRDTMGRVSGMTDGSGGPVWVQGITYDLASRMTQMQYPQYSSVFDYMSGIESVQRERAVEFDDVGAGSFGSGRAIGNSELQLYGDGAHGE